MAERDKTTAIARKVAHDLGVILDQARRHGTLKQLKQVPIFFSDEELRVILASLTREQEIENAR